MEAQALSWGPYRLLRRLDSSEMGDCYLARRRGPGGFEKPVVLWRAPDDRNAGARFVDNLVAEAKRAARLSHANIAHVLDVGLVGRTCFVVTEFTPGVPLETVLRRARPLPWPVAATITKETARALGYAHTRREDDGALARMVHGRLCPKRIVLGHTGGIKLTGFGISWAWRRDQAYRAPEETRDEPIDGRADVFSLGLILEACLPRRGVPHALRMTVAHATERYQEHRATARELEDDLTAILHRERSASAAERLAWVGMLSPRSQIRNGMR